MTSNGMSPMTALASGETSGAAGVRWIVSQIGSRERYAVPRAFHARGHLGHFFTDIWSGRAVSLAKRLPRGDAFAHRFHAELPHELVTGFNLFGLHCATRHLWRGRPKTMAEQYDEYTWIGREFAQRVNGGLSRMKLDPATWAAFLFSTGALETCQFLRERGVPIVVDQLDPAQLDEQMIQEEIERWPGWEEFPGKIPASYYDRLIEEWRLADIVLVNSNWSRSSLLKQGVDAKKIIVVPLCYEPDPHQPAATPRAAASTKPLNVLWLGQIVLRKGIPYLFEAAAKLMNANVRITVAGRVGISDKGIRAAPPNVNILGKITHAEAVRCYSQADVFVLPTLSDGFALTQLEAMSFGVPVITTPNCGDVVTHGRDGYILPPRDSQAMADAIAGLEGNRQLLHEMSAQAIETVKHPRYSLAGYADAVEGALAAFRASAGDSNASSPLSASSTAGR
jgi:glycosyltransferase involved in cell wall biosynthesis